MCVMAHRDIIIARACLYLYDDTATTDAARLEIRFFLRTYLDGMTVSPQATSRRFEVEKNLFRDKFFVVVIETCFWCS